MSTAVRVVSPQCIVPSVPVTGQYPSAANGSGTAQRSLRTCAPASSGRGALACRPGRTRSTHLLRAAVRPSSSTQLSAASANSGSTSGSGSDWAAAQPTRPGVDIAIEVSPNNSRCIWAGVDVAAPAAAVYAALTTYENLGNFIPGLAENRCLERYPDGCKLLQVGQQDLALGIKFCARCCLRITTHPSGIPRRMLTLGPNSRPPANGGSGGNGGNSSSSGGEGGGWWHPFGAPLPGLPANPPLPPMPLFSSMSSGGSSGSGSDEDQGFNERRYLRPRSPLGQAPGSDIAFDLIEGDFSSFKGLWRIQPSGPATCRLSYSLFVRPQPWLLVGLIEQRISREIAANLAAVRAYVERQTAAGGR